MKRKPQQPLTCRQQAMLTAIKRYIKKHKWAPTVRELGELMDIGSPNGVLCHLLALEKKGYIVRSPNGEARAMYVVE
jgi:repressor LexA